ncbi:hypothetical protein IFR04_015338, partial [Cadophora malorum]
MKVTSILWLAMAIPQALAVPEPVLRSLYSVDRPRPKQRLGEDPMKNSAFSRKTSPSKDGGTEVFKTMKPLKGSGGLSQRPRPGDSMTDVSLKDKIVLAWREEETGVDAELSASWENMSNVKVINMEDFIDTVGNVDCTAPHMYLDFSDSSVYSAAKQEWQWVNNNNQNNIVIFANHPKCTDDGSREPYIVTSTQFNDTLTRVDFTVEKTASYDDVLNDAELGYHTWYEPDEALLAAVWNQTAEDVKETHVAFEKRGVVERALANETLPALAKTKRDGVSISVNQRFDDRDIFRKEFAEEGLSGSIALVCKTCATRGRIRIQGTIQWSGFWPAAAYVDFIATDVQSEFLLQLLLNVKFDQADQVPLYQLGASVEVKNLFSASLLLGIGVGYEWSIEAEGSVEFGTRGKMRDGVQRTCFFGCSNSKSG